MLPHDVRVISSNTINQDIAKIKDKGRISDGYHTFDELYEHRINLFIALCKCNKNIAWKARTHSDGSSIEGWFIMGLHFEPGKQITYHLPMSKWRDCSEIASLWKAPEWDEHTSEDVLKRLLTIGEE